MLSPLASLAIGIWLMFAPAVLGVGGVAADSDRIAGPIVASLSTIALWEATRGARYGNYLPAVWLIGAPLALEYGGAASVSSLASGLLLVLFTLLPAPRKQRMGGGWRVLVREGWKA